MKKEELKQLEELIKKFLDWQFELEENDEEYCKMSEYYFINAQGYFDK